MAVQERHLLICGPEPAADWRCLHALLASAAVVGLCRPEEEAMLRAALRPGWCHQGGRAERLCHGDTRPLLSTGAKAAVVVGSGGSRGQRRWCLQPLDHLLRAARALVGWPAEMCGPGHKVLPLALAGLANPLPLHHVSGLMPALRSQALGIPHRFLSRRQWRDRTQRPSLRGWGLVLVPSQLQWLMGEPGGVDWLRQLSCCWVGGAPLAPALRQRARCSRLNLSPCYGSTETSAMVTALAPRQFLAGVEGYGFPLPHVALRSVSVLGSPGVLEIRTPVLAPGFLVEGRLLPLPLENGWWRTTDSARLEPHGLQVLGRLDGAINSGGETVFPEEIEAGLVGLDGLEAVLVVGVEDVHWGQRLVALYRGTVAVGVLEKAVSGRPPAQRPKQWLRCPRLAPNTQGKWDRRRWQAWAQGNGPYGS
ncbi:MAG: AMP-binding protein [Synechococcus sp. SB0666_bin_14]|nr:AMP-binding protein [Synechococcus sp. SB0666_bin_14]MYG46889.1 AMP-binding protein [Synechococcus sp. SB0675_bin_6]MYJ59407.1 AMP-binding protein [Synechococcus sp. SB0672_bin_6]MYK91248.1 AMP-binding protein [Synechococcus sp. SB0669_bin_8]